MSLPKIEHPLFDVTIPSTGEKVKFRPFTVKEEKILLIAQQSEDSEQVVNSIKQIVNNCVQGIDVDKLAMFDLEFIILSLRSKSVNNVIDFSVIDPETEERVNLSLNLDLVKVVYDEKHDKNIKIDDKSVFTMRYPSINELKDIIDEPDNEEIIFKALVSCVDKLFYGDQVYDMKSYSYEERSEFVESLDSSVLEKMKVFFETMPKIRHEIDYTNANGNKKKFVIEGLDNFFI